MDFIEGLPVSESCDTILVVVDRFTKYAHFLALKHPFSANTVAKLVMDQVVKLHGMPKTIVSDRDKVFTSVFWQSLFATFNTKLLRSSGYHPQMDGQTERVNQCLEMFLRCAVQAAPRKWRVWLPLAELWYNSSYHTALGCSPFKALYGYEAPMHALLSLPVSDQSPAVDMLQEREAHLILLKGHLAAAQNRMKLQADRHRTDRQFQVGEQVLLKLQPYVQSTVVSRSFPNLWTIQSLRAYWCSGIQAGIADGVYGASGVPCLAIEAICARFYTGVPGSSQSGGPVHAYAGT